MILEESYTLSNGVEIPRLGLGTWLVGDGDVAQAVEHALRIGYRLIDTAQAYDNESGVGDGIRSSGVKREEIFVTSKVAAEIKSYREAVASIDESLRKLGLDDIDLMLIHCPQPWDEFGGAERYFAGNLEVWRALEEAHEAGKLRAIGVSNFEQPDIDNILESCDVAPMVNQILAHIGRTPAELIEYSQARGMLVEAYSPLGHGNLLKNETVAALAERYGVSLPRLAIRYALQLGLLPIPKSADPEHIETNARVDFEISKEDMDFLRNLEIVRDPDDAD